MDNFQDFETACDALTRGYANDQTMFDDSMVGAAQTLAGQPQRLHALLRELRELRGLVRQARGAWVRDISREPTHVDQADAAAWLVRSLVFVP